tara:strand:- start:76 stop:1182 length:1107 start_codon:yes stop_codon:yes gene_type:complete
MIERITLKNFTVFNDVSLDLSPKINVVIGENGTGKTQLLKALYFSNKSLATQDATSDDLLRLFRPLSNSLKGLVGDDGKSKAELTCQLATGQNMTISFSSGSKQLAKDKFLSTPVVGAPNLIPVKEVLSLMRGMLTGRLSTETLQLLFDQSYLDISKSLAKKAPTNAGEKIDQDPRFSAIYIKLIKLLGGRFEVSVLANQAYVTFKAGHFDQVKDTKSENHGKTTFRVKRSDSADMTAEGLRKLGTLQLLLENHSINPGQGGIVLWDEPEANLNPKLMKLVVELLLELARNGQQVVVATHDYVLLKWFDLLVRPGKGDHIRFHALANDGDKVTVQSAESYKELDNNAISNTYSDLYDAEIKRSLGGEK